MTRYLVKRLERLGYDVTLTSEKAAACGYFQSSSVVGSERLLPIAAAGQDTASTCGRSFARGHWASLADLLPMGIGIGDQLRFVAIVPQVQGIDVPVLQEDLEPPVDDLEVRGINRELVLN